MEGGGTDGAERPGDGRGQFDATKSGAPSGDDALPVVTLLVPSEEAGEKSASISQAADGNGQRGGVNGGERMQDRGAEGCALMEAAGPPPSAAQRAAIAAGASRSSPSPRLPSPNSRVMDLASILNVQAAGKEATEIAAGAGAEDVDMDDGHVESDVEMAEPVDSASVAAVMTAPQTMKEGDATETTKPTDANGKMEEKSAVVDVEEPVAAAKGENNQEQSTVTEAAKPGDPAPLGGPAAADSDEQMDGEGPEKTPKKPTDGHVETAQRSAATGTVPMKDPASSSDSISANTEETSPVMPAQSDEQEQSTVGVVGTQKPAASTIKADNGAPPSDSTAANTSSLTVRSTRSSRKKSSRVGETKNAATPSSRHPMHADLTLETVSGGGDASTTATGKAPSKKRSQRASKAVNAAPARATKRSRTREKQVAAGAEEDDQEDDEVLFLKQQPAPALPPRARSRKRRQMTEDSELLEPPPIIDDPPPLPFTTHSPRRSSSHSASPNRGAPTDRACEFCNHAVDMCALLICKACRRAYHVRCLVRRFKKYWPAEGSVEARLKKLQEEARDRRVSLFRCGSCRAAFAEFVDIPDKYLQSCTCPTCTQPELLATFRRNKLFEMLLLMNEAKALGKQGVSSKASTTSVASDASADSGSGETKKKPNRLTRGSSADHDADGGAKTRGGSTRRKSSRPARRGAVGHSDSEAANENGMEDVITGFSTAENSPTKQPATDASASESGVAPPNAETALVMDDAARALTELSLADAETSQPASVPVAPEECGADDTSLATGVDISDPQEGQTKAPSKKEGELMDMMLNLVELCTDKGMVSFPIVCLRHRLDHGDTSKLADGDPRSFDVSKLRESVVGSGDCSWVSRKIFVRCSCCSGQMQLGAFAKHIGVVATGKELRHHLLAVHRNNVTSTPFERFISAVRWKAKIHGSVEAAFSSDASVSEATPAKTQSSDTRLELASDILKMAIPRKKGVAAAAAAHKVDASADTKRHQSLHSGDMLNSLNADIVREIKQDAGAAEIEAAFQRVKEVMLVKRNRQSKMSHAIHDAADTDADPLDYLVKVVSVDHNYLAVTADGATRDRMFEVPQGAAKRRVGWLALSAARRFSRSVYCECCEKALSVGEFIAHSDLRPNDGKRFVLHVMERVSPSRVQSFAQFCRNAALIARAGGDRSFAAVLAELQEFPVASSAPVDAAAS